MGVNTPLSPALVTQIIQQEEIAARCRTMDRETVETVFRYGAVVGSSLERFSRLPSGLDMARQRIAQAENAGRAFAGGLVILADELTGGRGRFQRPWHAPLGGAWMTLVLVNTLLPEAARFYPLAIGVACCEALADHVPQARIKWVNDVLADGRKLCGTLIETMFGPRYGEEYVLIGVGVNVNNLEFPPELAGLAGSVRQVLGREVDLELFTGRLLAKIAWNIGLLHYEEARRLRAADGTEADWGEHPIIQRWRQLSDTIGRRVRFGFDVQQRPQYQARVLDIDPDGGLVLQPTSGGPSLVETAGELVYLD